MPEPYGPPTDDLVWYRRQVDWGNQKRAEQFMALLKAAKHARFHLDQERSRRGTSGLTQLDELLHELDTVIEAAGAGEEK